MLYPKTKLPELPDELFRNPTSEYRGAPFWAWNTHLEKETLLEQIENFKVMGMGGFHMHVRTGMDSPYLDEEFMGHIATCVEKAKQEGMKACLYDEDRWPSGTAGGMVTREHPEYAMHNLLFTPWPYGQGHKQCGERFDPGRGGFREENGCLLAVYDIVLGEDGCLRSARRIENAAEARGTVWYAYDEQANPSPWVNGAPYVDTLNQQAIARFLQVTHEKYYARFGAEFGSVIPSIFTDEPQFAKKTQLDSPGSQTDLFLPWSPDFPERFRDYCGLDIFEALPEVIWELPEGEISHKRYLYHDFVTEAFVSSYCDTIGDWCEAHGIVSAGHLMNEDTLESQTAYVGESMRGYRSFKVLPGMDLLCDRHLYNTAKQCDSVAHQQGGEGVLSELYGVTGWDYDFRGHKHQGDWQAALGVTFRVPHLTWMSMKGEAKRDYPACIGYQSPWWSRYGMIEDHFARVNTAMTRGKPGVRLAVIHPIESFWLYYGNREQTQSIRDQRTRHHEALTETLLFGLIDFDFVSESLLPGLYKETKDGKFHVGAMTYDCVLVPGCKTLRSTTLDALESFSDAGGRLIFLGEQPDHENALPSLRPGTLYARSEQLDFDGNKILKALEPLRFLDIHIEKTEGPGCFQDCKTGTRSNDLIYRLREDGDHLWLFVAHGKPPLTPDADPLLTLSFSLRGCFRISEYDTLSGEIRPLKAGCDGTKTEFSRRFYMHDSLLLRLDPLPAGTRSPEVATGGMLLPGMTPRMQLGKVDYRLSEPNALLLDMAEWSLDGGPFAPCEEFLRLDNLCRDRIGLPRRKKHIMQPYMLKKEIPTHNLTLRMEVPSELEYCGAVLALEDAEDAEIIFNGEKVPSVPVSWYVDKSIQCVALPKIKKGRNLLTVTWPLGIRTNLEYCYLLGAFGVRVEGTCKTLIPLPKQLAFGDITRQGLPFYTGNVEYLLPVTVPECGRFALRVEQYRGALVDLKLDGQPAGTVMASPYLAELEATPGNHTVSLLLYGTRQNGFAQLHHTPGLWFYQSPDSWRSTGVEWQYEYQLKRQGILKSPLIFGA